MTVTFVIGISGLGTSIDEFYATEQEWANADLPPNVSWEHITVNDENAVDEWLQAKNRQLRAWWTPNQDAEEKAENGIIANEAQMTMDHLEVRAEQHA